MRHIIGQLLKMLETVLIESSSLLKNRLGLKFLA